MPLQCRISCGRDNGGCCTHLALADGTADTGRIEHRRWEPLRREQSTNSWTLPRVAISLVLAGPLPLLREAPSQDDSSSRCYLPYGTWASDHPFHVRHIAAGAFASAPFSTRTRTESTQLNSAQRWRAVTPRQQVNAPRRSSF